jgi:hypothetical protein
MAVDDVALPSFDGRTRPATPCERTDRILTPVSTIEPSKYYKSPEVRLFQLFLPPQYSMIVTDGFPAISPDHQE